MSNGNIMDLDTVHLEHAVYAHVDDTDCATRRHFLAD